MNRGELIGSDLIIFCYKEFGKLTLRKSISQLELIFIVFPGPFKSGHVKTNFS